MHFFHAGHQEPAHFQAERRDTLNFHGNTAAIKAGHELFPAVAQEDSLGSGLAAQGPGTDRWGSLLKRLWAVLQGMPPCPWHLHTYWLKLSSRIQWGSLEMGQPERMGSRPQSTSGCRLLSASAGRTTLGTTKLGLKPRNLGNLLAPLIAPGLESSPAPRWPPPSLQTLCALSSPCTHGQAEKGHPRLMLWARFLANIFNNYLVR